MQEEGKVPNVEEFEPKKVEKNCNGFDQSTDEGYMSFLQCQDELAGIKSKFLTGKILEKTKSKHPIDKV